MGDVIVSRGPQRGAKVVVGRAVLVRQRQGGQKSANTHDLTALNAALTSMKATAANFAIRFIDDAKVRKQYVEAADAYASRILKEVASGQLTPEQGAENANRMRNGIMEAARLRSSDLGRARAKDLKPTGLTLDDLKEKYAKRLFGKGFADLAQNEKNLVALEIVKASGRTNPQVTAGSRALGKLGKGLWYFSLGVAVYNVSVAEDKAEAIVKEGVSFGGGLAGAAALGSAGLLFGPAAPIAVPIGIFVGGILGAMGAEITFDWLKD
jgi:hypothetical protein